MAHTTDRLEEATQPTGRTHPLIPGAVDALQQSADDAYLRLHRACSQRGIRVEYSNGPRITEPTIKLVAGVVTYFVPKSWDLEDALNRLDGLHDGAREHREQELTGGQLAGQECARPNCGCRNRDLAYADGEIDYRVGERQLKACNPFEVLRDGASPKLAAFLDLADEVIRETGDLEEFATWLLDAIESRR